MITDIPDAAEFRSNGIAFINLAWESILNLCMNVDEVLESINFEGDNEEENQQSKDAYKTDYWKESQRELAVDVALIQQGTEFLLKWKIGMVSPFLLLSGEQQNKWPGADKSFADFKTVDAQDLPRIHDTVAHERLSENFKRHFEVFRKIRNTVLHSVPTNRFTAQDGLIGILETSNALLDDKSWAEVRRRHYNEKAGILDRHYYHYTDNRLASEMWQALRELKPAEIKRFFDFDPKGRRYTCPTCAMQCSDVGLDYDLAQLKPKSSLATKVFCIACGQTNEVVRRQCSSGNCRGNVISEEFGHCLTCGH